MFGATEDTNLPRSLKTEADKVAFYSDMAEYYDASSKVDKAAQNQSAVASGYPAMFSAGAKEAHQNSQEKLAKAIRDKYRISESKFDRYEHWIATDKWRKQLNWSQMMSEMHELSAEKERLLKPALSSKTDFITAMDALSPKHLERIVDLWSEDTQFELHSLHQTVVDAFALVSGESDQQWADQQWQSPTSLWALNGAGFSESIFKKLGGDLRAPLPDLAKSTSDENSEINSDENTDKSLSEHLSKLGMGLSIHSKLGDFISNPNTHETLILKDLAKGFSQLDGIFTASAAAITRFVAEMGADAISKSTVMMLASINTPVTRNTFYLRALILERLASATTIEINPNYASDFKKWNNQFQNRVEELKKQNCYCKSFRSE
ncbi:putative membrane protein [Vibrio maritimus]|uniref:Putative membrane protein n=1 Tax=Vibrio maritimus TaxID=990268 RepID=A0A090S207_9VIBR|nr:putative membrane protein [Vibrio maritimus]